jgi:hypothetical protein
VATKTGGPGSGHLCAVCSGELAFDARFCSTCGAKIAIAPNDTPKRAKGQYIENAAARWATKTNKNKTSSTPLCVVAIIVICATGFGLYSFSEHQPQRRRSLGLTPEQLFNTFNSNSGKTLLVMSRPESYGLNGFNAFIKLGNQEQSSLKLSGNLDSKGEITLLNLTQTSVATTEADDITDSSRFVFSEMCLLNALDPALKGKPLNSLMQSLNPKLEHSERVYRGAKFELQTGGSFLEPFRWKFSATKLSDSTQADDQSLTDNTISADTTPNESPSPTPTSIPNPSVSPGQSADSSSTDTQSAVPENEPPAQSPAPIPEPLPNSATNEILAFNGSAPNDTDWVKHVYKRSAGPEVSEATLSVETKGNLCRFAIATHGEAGECRLDGNGIIKNGTVNYPGLNEGGTIILNQTDASSIVVTGGVDYCSHGAALAGTYGLTQQP